MRSLTAISAIALAVVMGFASTTLADKDKDDAAKVKVKKVEKNHDEGWGRGFWTHGKEKEVTVRTYEGRPEGLAARPIEPGIPLRRQFTGPYTYFFTDREGKYNYYLDHYDYPYAYGGRETNLPVGVLGYVPPQEIGGGPVKYYRERRPLSWSISDMRRGLE